jgi:MFS family permease
MSSSSDGASATSATGRSYLYDPDFVLICLSRFTVTIGSQVKFVAIGWYIYDLTNDPFALGFVGLATFLPAIVLTLFVGLVADRFDRRQVLAICSTVMSTAAFFQLLNIATGTNATWVIYLMVIVYGTGRAFFNPASSALLTNIVKPQHLANAVATASIASQTAFVSGPAVGGFLYWFDPRLPFAVALFCFAVSVLCYLFMTPRANTEPVAKQSSWRELFAGFTFMWSKPVIFGAIVLDMVAVVLGGAQGLLPIYARDILNVDAWGLGLLRSAPAVGALLVSIFIARHTFVNRNSGPILLVSVAVFGLATLLFGLSTSFVLSLICLTITGAADMVSVVIRLTLVQAETPNELRGRVAAVNSLFTSFSNEIGQFRAGVMAGLFGAIPAVVAGGLGAIALAWAWARFFPELAKRDHLVTPLPGTEPAKAGQQG